MVRVRGLEPLSLTAQPPQDCVSTSFTTPACALRHYYTKKSERRREEDPLLFLQQPFCPG